MNKNTIGLQIISDAASGVFLEVLGAIRSLHSDPVPDSTKTIVLLGPKEPGFWPYLNEQPELSDGKTDPIDRWSERAVSCLAKQSGGTAVFPFGGPPFAPFIDWAQRTGQVWQSPVSLLVHATSGLFLSFRGAICLPYDIDDLEVAQNPCQRCNDQPCKTACPVNAIGPNGYDLGACHGFLNTKSGSDCLKNGCAVRRACPVSQRYGRLPAQSAHHMKAFHP